MSAPPLPRPISEPEVAAWRGTLRTGAAAALGSVALIVVQLVVFAVWPPPHTAPEVLDLMAREPLLGLVSLDALYVVNNVFVLLLYVALAICLWREHRGVVTIALVLGVLQMASYMASNPAVELLHLTGRYADATGQDRLVLLAAGEAQLAAWKGTAFLVYYELGAIVLLLFASALLRSSLFSRATGVWALASGVLMLVPSTVAGPVGLAFGVGSLVPWSVMCLLLARRLGVLSRST